MITGQNNDQRFSSSNFNDAKIGDQLAQGTKGIITGFKGLFKKVMD